MIKDLHIRFIKNNSNVSKRLYRYFKKRYADNKHMIKLLNITGFGGNVN